MLLKLNDLSEVAVKSKISINELVSLFNTEKNALVITGSAEEILGHLFENLKNEYEIAYYRSPSKAYFLSKLIEVEMISQEIEILICNISNEDKICWMSKSEWRKRAIVSIKEVTTVAKIRATYEDAVFSAKRKDTEWQRYILLKWLTIANTIDGFKEVYMFANDTDIKQLAVLKILEIIAQ